MMDGDHKYIKCLRKVITTYYGYKQLWANDLLNFAQPHALVYNLAGLSNNYYHQVREEKTGNAY